MTIKPVVSQKSGEKKENHGHQESQNQNLGVPSVRTNHRNVVLNNKSNVEGQSPQRRDVFEDISPRHGRSPHKSGTRSKRDHHKREQREREKISSSPSQYHHHHNSNSSQSSSSSGKSPKNVTLTGNGPTGSVQSNSTNLVTIVEETFSGYNSGDEHLMPKENLLTPSEWKDRDEEFVKSMSERGFVIKDIIEDGACLFRAISLQIYGDQEMHEVIRQQTMDYIQQNCEYFAHFVTEDINSYIKRKRNTNSHGNHIEIQAMSEIYNRPVELYCYKTTPINIFNSAQINNGYDPLRLSYQRGSHYNAILDPYNASVGVGLGLADYKPESQTREAIKLSEQLEIEQTMFEDKLKTTDWEATNEAIEEQIARESYLQWCRENMQQNPEQNNKTSSNTTSSSSSTISSTSSTVTSAEAHQSNFIINNNNNNNMATTSTSGMATNSINNNNSNNNNNGNNINCTNSSTSCKESTVLHQKYHDCNNIMKETNDKTISTSTKIELISKKNKKMKNNKSEIASIDSSGSDDTTDMSSTSSIMKIGHFKPKLSLSKLKSKSKSKTKSKSTKCIGILASSGHHHYQQRHHQQQQQQRRHNNNNIENKLIINENPSNDIINRLDSTSSTESSPALMTTVSTLALMTSTISTSSLVSKRQLKRCLNDENFYNKTDDGGEEAEGYQDYKIYKIDNDIQNRVDEYNGKKKKRMNNSSDDDDINEKSYYDANQQAANNSINNIISNNNNNINNNNRNNDSSNNKSSSSTMMSSNSESINNLNSNNNNNNRNNNNNSNNCCSTSSSSSSVYCSTSSSSNDHNNRINYNNENIIIRKYDNEKMLLHANTRDGCYTDDEKLMINRKEDIKVMTALAIESPIRQAVRSNLPCTSKQAEEYMPVSTFYQSLLESSYTEDGLCQLSENEMIKQAIQMSTMDYIEEQKRKYGLDTLEAQDTGDEDSDTSNI